MLIICNWGSDLQLGAQLKFRFASCSYLLDKITRRDREEFHQLKITFLRRPTASAPGVATNPHSERSAYVRTGSYELALEILPPNSSAAQIQVSLPRYVGAIELSLPSAAGPQRILYGVKCWPRTNPVMKIGLQDKQTADRVAVQGSTFTPRPKPLHVGSIPCFKYAVGPRSSSQFL